MNFALEVPSGGRILDICSGIDMLSDAAAIYHASNPGDFEFTLVELDETYCEVARRLLPDAAIIFGYIIDPAVQDRLSNKSFNCAISNPPYCSKNVASGNGNRNNGRK